jgi:hypothetical protein
MRSRWWALRGRVRLEECFFSFFCFILYAIAMGRDTGPNFGDEQMTEGSTHKDSGRNDEED